MTINNIMEIELPAKLYYIRKKILQRVYDYMRYTYGEQPADKGDYSAMSIIMDRIVYKSHYTLRITDGL